MSWKDDIVQPGKSRPVYEHFELSIEDMVGLTFITVKREVESLVFTDEQNRQWEFCHHQDCCEDVYIEDICGDLEDLVGSPLVLAEETTNSDAPPKGEYEESYTWTFYRFATAKGTVTVRWYGSSNGYYSESVDLEVTRRLR